MQILFFGNNVRGTVCLKALLDTNSQVAGVVAHPDSAALWGETVADLARRAGLRLLQPSKVNGREFLDQVRQMGVDLGVMAGFSPIIRKELLSLPRYGFINLHGGLVPQYRGSSITRWVLLNNESQAGVSILQVDEGIDTGEILAEATFQVGCEFRALDIINRQLEIFPELLLKVVRQFENGTVTRKPQKREEGCCWHVLKPEDGLVHWERMTARTIYNWVRGFDYPYAGAFSFYGGEKCYLRLAGELNETLRGIPGRICGVRGKGLVVIARDRGILVERIQFAGQDEQWARGVLPVGTKFD